MPVCNGQTVGSVPFSIFLEIKVSMKSAYELAIERLEKQSPTAKLSDEQKREIAEIESTCKARIAERELFLKEQITKERSAGKFDEVEALEKQLARELRRLNAGWEAK